MCLSPIKIKNPKHRISLAGGDSYYIEVPCGECAECKKIMRDQWYVRTYYEAQSTFDSDGYIYFDTLTYKNEKLPHMSEYCNLDPQYDCSCFRVEDYRNFMAQLREEWHRLYMSGKLSGDSVGNLKYFLTSEYGTDPNCTHRPHYHVLFFVRNNAIDWYTLSKLVAKCWYKNGRTDGFGYKPMTYIVNHVYSKKQNNDLLHLQTVCNYVSKYITKDSDFQKVVDERLYQLFKQKYLNSGYNYEEGMTLDDMLYCLGESAQEKCKELKKNMNQFHRQSKGFGEDWLKYNDYDEVFKTGMISMMDKHNIIKHVPIPSYYQMKVWYDLVKVNGKALRWELNEEGKKYKFSKIFKNIELVSNKVEDWLNNMKSYNYYAPVGNEEWYDNIYNKFIELNEGRDLKQFAVYNIFYKGRIKDPEWYKRSLECIFDSSKENYATDPFEFWMIKYDPLLQYENEIKAFNNEGRSVIYGYNHHSYKKAFGCKFISREDLGTKIDWENGEMSAKVRVWLNYLGQFQLSNDYIPSLLKSRMRKMFDISDSDSFDMTIRIVSDKDDPGFKNYDKMWNLYVEGQKFKNVMKQSGFDEIEALKKKHKSIFNKNI